MELQFNESDLFERSVAEIIDGDRIKKAALSGTKLNIKLGIDPTSVNIHLGRSIPLWRLRAFQELGHHIHIIIGDFTGQVGDTSDKESERPMLTPEVIATNLARYQEQLWMILNPAKKDLVTFHYNSAWLSSLSFSQVCVLADAFSVNNFIKRELISRRLDSGSRVSLREMIYPLMQGYDSVMVNADIELGGTDQRFNLLSGRTLQEQAGQVPQAVIMNTLINGLDGRKMSSSWGNVISLLDSPQDKFGKCMTLADALMEEFLLVFPRSAEPFSAEELRSRLAAGENPRDLKLALATALVALYHGDEEGVTQREQFISQFSKGDLPEDIEERSISSLEGETKLFSVLTKIGFASSNTEARLLLQQGGVKINSQVITDIHQVQTFSSGDILQVGKRKFVRFVQG